MKKKRVETFRNIQYQVGHIIIDSAAAVSPPVGLAQARPNYTYLISTLVPKLDPKRKKKQGRAWDILAHDFRYMMSTWT